MDQGSSLLLGIEGLQVIDVRLNADGRRVVRCATSAELAGWCPACGEQSTSPKGWVTTRPRDVVVGPDVPILVWRKRKWRCKVSWCERKTFTGSLPAIPARSRLTARLCELARYVAYSLHGIWPFLVSYLAVSACWCLTGAGSGCDP